MLVAGIVFALSFLGIVALFVIKHVEMRGRKVVAGAARERADERALEFKSYLARAGEGVAHIPPTLARLSWLIVHEAALILAYVARLLERQARKIADFVSHKRGFEPREVKSEFLREVGESRGGVLRDDEQS